MQLNQTLVKVQTNHTGQTIRAGIEEGAIAHIMQLLSGLYSNIHEALLREYSTNALDSHIQAGVKRPIEVSLPGRFSNNLVIQDYGLGMSVDDLVNIFSRYGASTKRDSNEVNGALGVGAKSAWAYTNSFSMVAVKNGVKTTAGLNKGSDGVGNIDIMDTSATDEPNGVKIIIPVSAGDAYKFKTNAEQFFRYWNPDDVLIDGQKPVPFYDRPDVLDLGDSIYISHSHNGVAKNGRDTIIMGGVAYPLDDKHSLGSFGYNRVIVQAEMPAVAFTPSRESLNYTPETVAYIEKRAKQARELLVKHVSTQINGAKTYHEAAMLAEKFNKYGVVPQYKGLDIPKYCVYHEVTPNKTRHERHLTITNANNEWVVIKNFPGTKVSKIQRMKMVKHTDATKIYVLQKSEDAVWFDICKIYDWADVVKEKVAGEKRGFSWGVLNGHGGVDEVEELGDKIVWIDSTNKPTKDRREAFYKAYPDYQIVIKRVKYAKQFEKEYPGALELKTFAAKERARIQANIDQSAKYNYYDNEALARIDRLDMRIDDPDIAHHVATFRNAEKVACGGDTRAYNFGRQWFGWNAFQEKAEMKPFAERYPLVNGSGPGEHILTYINAIYNTYYSKDAQ